VVLEPLELPDTVWLVLAITVEQPITRADITARRLANSDRQVQVLVQQRLIREEPRAALAWSRHSRGHDGSSFSAPRRSLPWRAPAIHPVATIRAAAARVIHSRNWLNESPNRPLDVALCSADAAGVVCR
jgi:hypothetical protein